MEKKDLIEKLPSMISQLLVHSDGLSMWPNTPPMHHLLKTRYDSTMNEWQLSYPKFYFGNLF
jgi:hypothetical protein